MAQAPTPLWLRVLWWVLLFAAFALLQSSQQRQSSGRPPLFAIHINSNTLQQWTHSSSATARQMWRKAVHVFSQQEEQLDMAAVLDSWTHGSSTDDSEDDEAYGCVNIFSTAKHKEICVVSK